MGLMDKLKGIIGIEDEYYDEDSVDEDYRGRSSDDYDADDSEPTVSEKLAEPEKPSYSDPSPRRGSNVVSMASSSAKMKISIQEPLAYDDGPGILDDIMSGKTVVLNLEMLEVEKKQQILDFVSGGIYSLSGNIQKVTKDIFVIVPKGVQVDGSIVDTMSSKSMYQL